MELVIMAAGMGSRYGGLKQLDSVDDNGNFIIDYSIYDAIRCGFDKVIFIIKKENYEVFRETIGKRVEDKIETVYVFQDNSNIPSKYPVPTERVKPFGTGHAVLCAKNAISSNFAVINSDDFYGYDAFKTVSEILKNNKEENHYSIVGYKAENTFCHYASIKRGVCNVDGTTLINIIESQITKNNDGTYTATPIDGRGREPFKISKGQTVSMSFFAFTPKFLEHLEENFHRFLEENKDNMMTAEFFLPTALTDLIQDGIATVDVVPTNALWFGMTYKEDKEFVRERINEEKSKGLYPYNLWNN